MSDWKPISTFPENLRDVVLVVECWSNPCTAIKTSNHGFVAIVDETTRLDEYGRNGLIKLDPIAWMELPKYPCRATRMEDGYVILWYKEDGYTVGFEVFDELGKPTGLTNSRLTLTEAYEIERRLIEVHGVKSHDKPNRITTRRRVR